MESHAAALEQIRFLLASGRYAPGTKLPAERPLATELNLSRAAVRRALSFLEAEGKVWRHVGQGTFVGEKPAESGTAFSMLGQRTNPREILELLRILEPNAAHLAALHASEDEFCEMERCARQCDSAESAEVYERRDAALHAAIAEGTRNALLVAVHTTVNATRLEASWGRLREAVLTPERQKKHCEQHHSIVDAIRRRSPREAATEMARHIDSVRENLLIKDEFSDSE